MKFLIGRSFKLLKSLRLNKNTEIFKLTSCSWRFEVHGTFILFKYLLNLSTNLTWNFAVLTLLSIQLSYQRYTDFLFFHLLNIFSTSFVVRRTFKVKRNSKINYRDIVRFHTSLNLNNIKSRNCSFNFPRAFIHNLQHWRVYRVLV